MSDFLSALNGLNPAQKRAASVVDGPVLVIAGAGTGKTRTLVHRLVHLAQQGVPPETILLLTFSRRAAQEMIQRAGEQLRHRDYRVAGGTFHSFANLMLRKYGGKLGFAAGFSVIDQGDSFQILSRLRSQLNKKAKGSLPRRETLARVISRSLNLQLPLETVIEDEFSHFLGLLPDVETIAAQYAEYKQEQQLLDFDDLLLGLLNLLQHEELSRKIGSRYHYIMIDEYQDTNPVQARIVEGLARSHRNIMVVGDDAQSIYGFRGASSRNLFDFQNKFAPTTRITLEQNYRSTQPILEVANALMQQMQTVFPKTLSATRRGSGMPILAAVDNEGAQALFIINEIKRLQRREELEPEQIAVLFRASRHAYPLEMELARNNMDYIKYGGFKFTETAHIKDVLAFLRILHNPSNHLDLERILLLFSGVGPASAGKISSAVREDDIPRALRESSGPAKARPQLLRTADFLESINPKTDKPDAILERVVEFYQPLLEEHYDDWPRRKRDLQQLAGMCREFRSLEEMVNSLVIDAPNASTRDQELAGDKKKGTLVLSTMHSAKGLEWDSVFIMQAVDGDVPMFNTFTNEAPDPEHLDEELRLFYVAVTRAKNRLYIIAPRLTARGGWSRLSRFLEPMAESRFECRYIEDLDQ